MQSNWLNTPGRYKARVLKPQGGWFHESTEKKTPYIAIYLEVVDDVDCEGQMAKFTGYLSDKALPNTMRTLWQCFRFEGDLNALHEGRTTFEGMDVEITVEEEEYNGKTRCKVKWMNPPGYQPKAHGIAEDDAKVMLATLATKARQAAQAAKIEFDLPATSAPVAPKNPNPPSKGDDDVPF